MKNNIKELAIQLGRELKPTGLKRECCSYLYQSRILMAYAFYEMEQYDKCLLFVRRTIDALIIHMNSGNQYNLNVAKQTLTLVEALVQEITKDTSCVDVDTTDLWLHINLLQEKL